MSDYTLFNTLDYLKTEEDVRLYLEACREEAPDDEVFMRKANEIAAQARANIAPDAGSMVKLDAGG